MQAITHCSCVASTNDIARVRNTAMRRGTKQMTERGIEARCMRCQAVCMYTQLAAFLRDMHPSNCVLYNHSPKERPSLEGCWPFGAE